MKKIRSLYSIINILSVDVALGAVCSALFFAKLLHVTILPYGLISLGLSVWIIYTADHLLDASKMSIEASTARHRFHQQHFKTLSILCSIAALGTAVMICFIRKPVFVGGVVLVAVVGVYLLAHRFVKFPKEIFIAILYTSGVLLPSASVTLITLSQWPWSLIIQFTLTAFLNLILFSWFDRVSDHRDGSMSFVTTMGEKNSVIVIWIVPGLNALLLVVSSDLVASSILILMNIILILIFIKQESLRKGEAFRLIGDAVFLLPILYLLFTT